MKRVTSLIMAVVILFGLLTGYRVVYAATSDLNDYEKEIINAYLYTIYHKSSKWIRPYSYEGIKYDFVNCKEKKFDFNYRDPGGWAVNKRFIFPSYRKKYDALKKMDYLEISGIMVLNDTSMSAEIEERYDWIRANLVLYRITLGIYIKEIDGTLYAYGEKYKYKDISEKDIVTPYELTEEEYINFATWVSWEYPQSYTMYDMYGLNDPLLKIWKQLDGFFIPLVKMGGLQYSGCQRYLPAGWLEGVWHAYSVNAYPAGPEDPDRSGNGLIHEILKY
ncbi:hypothetical protein [Anaerocolumna sp.]|uniref:hypothetical protein n=1 Tax=Anaerocolumna sp. TaxID=2041569 RepID=UPI0028A970D6|nr:hypothetical protein [Anaerocolumna sp.]